MSETWISIDPEGSHRTMKNGVVGALAHAHRAIQAVALSYVLAAAAGVIMVHAGSSFALRVRDRVVLRAQSSAILEAHRTGSHVRAAMLDFAANLCLGGVSSTVVGTLFPAGVYPIAIYRGWIGGLVSVDRHHNSRLAGFTEALYYVIVMVLQLGGYSLAGGAGIMLGQARAAGATGSGAWLRIPASTWGDAWRVYAVAVALFLLGSLYEFLAR